MFEPSRSDLLPGSTVCSDSRRKFVILGGSGEISDCVQRSPVESVGEGLVLGWFWLHGSGSGEVSSLEVGSREICNGRSNDGAEIGD
jgi:hypothetical protein